MCFADKIDYNIGLYTIDYISPKMNIDNQGYLELILGPMFSGKTTQTIQIYNKYKYIGKKVCVINYMDDKRYDDTMLSSHDEMKIPCVFLRTLAEVWTHYEKLLSTESIQISREMREADVIIINEGQFFPDLFEVVMNMVEKKGKKVYICGLDGDYKRQKFGDLLDLIPFSDKITKLQSLCSQCRNGTLAIFTHRVTEELGQIVIGVNNYTPLCRKCYLEATK
jgi:thymidine kinase